MPEAKGRAGFDDFRYHRRPRVDSKEEDMWKRARERASIRTRLILLPTFVFCVGLLAAIAVTLLAARNRIDAETLSGVDLAGLVIRYALTGLATASDPEEALRRLQQELEKVRHVKVRYVARQSEAEPPPDERAAAWMPSFFASERIVARYPVTVRGEPRGMLVMSTRPSDEAAEIWGGLSFLTMLLAAIAAVIGVAILFTTRQTLKPLAELVEGLRRLRQGQFDALREIEVVELQEIGARFNELAAALARTRADNRLLVDRLMAIQDSERKALARELHDEFGAALFGIRAAASCILERTAFAASADPKDEIVRRAQTIATLAETLQQQSRRMLDRVRPQVLQRLGLCDALLDLVDRWRGTHQGIACDLSLPEAACTVDEETGATIYRIVQEGLTNVARHSEARHVRVTLGFDENKRSGTTLARLTVEDDGKGLPQDFRFGFGLLGMTERVRKLGGRLGVANGGTAGTRIDAILPLEAGRTETEVSPEATP
jgi:two-component system sensor histidine kinase UhpB